MDRSWGTVHTEDGVLRIVKYGALDTDIVIGHLVAEFQGYLYANTAELNHLNHSAMVLRGWNLQVTVGPHDTMR